MAEIEIEVFRRAQEHTGGGLTTATASAVRPAAGVGMVGAEVDGVEMGAPRGEPIPTLTHPVGEGDLIDLSSLSDLAGTQQLLRDTGVLP